jgi:peptidoglycan hydrolase-like protein with peptidoglycan-binding domain
MTMPDLDTDLIAAIKQAKSKPMFFAFIPKGADGKLMISKKKIAPKAIAEAKKEIGGGNPITGKCTGPAGDMEFTVAKDPPATFLPAIKKVAKRDTGLTLIGRIAVASDADTEEQEGEETASKPDAGTPPAAPPAPPTGGGNATMGLQKALAKLGYDPGKPDGVSGPKTKAAIQKFQKDHGLAADGVAGPKTQAALAQALKGGGAAGGGDAAKGGADAGGGGGAGKSPASDAAGKGKAAPLNLGPWQAVRQKAVTDLKALAMKVAKTKHGSAAGVLKEINSIIAKLPQAPGSHEIEKLEQFIKNDDTITAAEEVPGHFHELEIRKPLLEALAALKQ